MSVPFKEEADVDSGVGSADAETPPRVGSDGKSLFAAPDWAPPA